MSIGQRLRQEREARGLTQLAMAALVQASERTVNDWERDVSSPKAVVLAALGVHGFDVGYIVTGQRGYDPPPPLSAEEQVLVEHWRAASKPVRSAAMAVLLSGGHTLRAASSQQFHAAVGQVVQGDATVRDVVIHQTGAPYRVPPKKPTRKP